MSRNFKYFFFDSSCFPESYPNALRLIQKEKILLDAEFLPVLEAAETGFFEAQLEMQVAFASGTPGVPKHYKLARYYTDKIMKYNQGKVEAEVEGFTNSALLELDAGNLSTAKQDFIQAAKIMVNNLPPDNWDYRVFNYLNSDIFLEP